MLLIIKMKLQYYIMVSVFVLVNGRVKATKSSIRAGTMHPLSSNRANTIARLALTARLLFQYGVGLGYFSNVASASGALVRAD